MEGLARCYAWYFLNEHSYSWEVLALENPLLENPFVLVEHFRYSAQVVEHFPAAVEEEHTSCWLYLQVHPSEVLVEKGEPVYVQDEQVYVLGEQACDPLDFVLILLILMAFLLLLLLFSLN